MSESEACLHALERVVLPILDFDPVLRPSATVRPVGAFRDQALKTELANLAEQVRADLALFEVADENAIGPARVAAQGWPCASRAVGVANHRHPGRARRTR